MIVFQLFLYPPACESGRVFCMPSLSELTEALLYIKKLQQENPRKELDLIIKLLERETNLVIINTAY